MVVIDQQVRFDVFDHEKNTESLVVTGTVVGVNYAHKVFHVVCEVGGTEQRTSFKFCDIGTRVQVVTDNGRI